MEMGLPISDNTLDIIPNKSNRSWLFIKPIINTMSRIHLTFGILIILAMGIVGMTTKLVSIGEGIIIILITLIATPFLFQLLKNTPRRDM